MKNLIVQGIAQKLIRLEDNNKYIVYAHQSKRRNFDTRAKFDDTGQHRGRT